MRLPSSKDGLVHLDPVHCCALWNAFVHQQSLIHQWAQSLGPIALAANVMRLTEALSFEPEPGFVLVYRAFAKAERERLDTPAARPSGVQCWHNPRHTLRDHRRALEDVLRILPGPMLH